MAFPLRTRTRGRPGRNAGVVNVAAAPSFSNPLTGFTTDPVHGVWASDPLWVPPTDGGAVSSWRNGGSVGTPNLTQATGTKQPTYRASTAAFNNKPTVQGDGTDDFLGATFASISAPWYVVAVLAKGKAGNAEEAMWDDKRAEVIGYALTTDTTSGSKWGTGITAGIAGGTADANPHLVVCAYNGASSSIAIDGTTVASGNVGSGAAVGVTLFGSRVEAATTYFSSGHFAFWSLFTTDPTALPEWADFITWVETTYGLVIA